MRKDNLLVTFSGASHSGKTTLIHKLKDHINLIEPKKCEILSECIRERGIISIDEVRKDPERYFKLQLEIVVTKIEMEENAANTEGKIFLIDRSLADSLYYYTHFVSLGQLSENSQNEYEKFLSVLLKTAHKHFKEYYDFIVYTLPIPPEKNNDPMRRKNIAISQSNEAAMIKMFLDSFNPIFKSEVDAIKEFDYVLDEILVFSNGRGIFSSPAYNEHLKRIQTNF